MNKAHQLKNWENYPSMNTPLNAQNLNQIDVSVGIIDDRVIVLDETKASKVEISTLFSEVSYDEQTGIITFTRKSGATVTIDTPMEKIALNIYYDPVTEMLTLPLIDGTQMEVDLSRLITEYEFLDSDTIAFSVGVDGKVSAIVKEGSIEEKHLRPDYLADIKVETENAKTSAISAAESAVKSKSYAVGGTGTREEEDSDNAMEYARQAKESADKASEIAGGQFIPIAEKGVSEGVATLDLNGKVPMEQLPDDILTDITPDDIGAVKKSGDIMTGNLRIDSESPSLMVYKDDMGIAQEFKVGEDGSRGIWDSSGKWVVKTDVSGISTFNGNANTATKLGTSNVGSATKPIYLSAGTATASTSTVGSANIPVYLNAGTITSTGKSFANYVPKSGGTMTGALNLGNGIWNNIGDDVAIGDKNQAGSLCIKGLNGDTSICFVNQSETTNEKLTFIYGNQIYADKHFGVGETLWCNNFSDRNNYGHKIQMAFSTTTTAINSWVVGLHCFQAEVKDQNGNEWRPIYASGFGQQSSRRVKEHIETMTEEEARKILLLNPVTYDYKKSVDGKNCRGLIAEDVAPIIPSCVIGNVNCADDDEMSINSIGIDYAKLVPYLIKMVQIQQEEIQDLKSKISE